LRSLEAASVSLSINPFVSTDTQTISFAIDSNGTAVGTLDIFAGALVPASDSISSVTISINSAPDSTINTATNPVDATRQGQFGTSLTYAQTVVSAPFTCAVDSTATHPFPIPILITGTVDRLSGAVGGATGTAYDNNMDDVCLATIDSATNQWVCTAGSSRDARLTSPAWSYTMGIGKRQARGLIYDCGASGTVFAFAQIPLPAQPVPTDDNQSFAEKNKGAVVGISIGLFAFLVGVAYVGHRLYRYRGKYHAQRARAKEAEEVIEEMQIVGGQATAEDDETVMTPNPLVLQMGQLEKQLQTTDAALSFNNTRALQEGEKGESDRHIAELQRERDELAAQLSRIKAQLEWQQQQAQGMHNTGFTSSASELPPMPPVYRAPGAPAQATPVYGNTSSPSAPADMPPPPPAPSAYYTGGPAMPPPPPYGAAAAAPQGFAPALGREGSAGENRVQFGQFGPAQQKKKTNF